MKKAMVSYLFKDRVILLSHAITKKGMRIEVEPSLEIDPAKSNIEKCKDILQVLDNYKVGIQDPAQFDAPILSYLGIKNYRTLMKQAKLVFVENENGYVSFIPHENTKKYGYVPLYDLAVKVEESLVEEWYQGLIEAFNLCK